MRNCVCCCLLPLLCSVQQSTAGRSPDQEIMCSWVWILDVQAEEWGDLPLFALGASSGGAMVALLPFFLELQVE
jgi:hypothetical protein